ncbi:hypothetical protein [Vibrio sp. 99-70-13A1]|nr:hypothetical protein [Vibrio sp. 99-70-13A1]
MKLSKSTVVPMLVTATLTLAILATINNVSALGVVKDTVNGNKGWF